MVDYEQPTFIFEDENVRRVGAGAALPSGLDAAGAGVGRPDLIHEVDVQAFRHDSKEKTER